MKRYIMASLLVMGLAVNAQANPIEQRYKQSCGACHTVGALGAPKTGDKAAWAPIMKKGEAVLLSHVKQGYKMMPAKGLCNDCTDAEFKALIKYMSK